MKISDLVQRGLSLDKLRAFLAVVAAGSVTGAAGGASSRRSLMSRQIGELESTLGFELFQRRGKTLVLTSVGRELALLVSAFFREFEAAVARVESGRSILRIGGGAATFDSLVFPRMLVIRKTFSDRVLEFISDSTDALVESLRQGHIDMAILRAGKVGEGYLCYPCGRIEFVLIGRRDFDSKLPTWTLPQFLGNVPLTLIRGKGQFLNALNRMCEQLGLKLVPEVMVDSFTQVRELLLQGQPAGLLPKQMAAGLPSGEFHILQDDRLGVLGRDLEMVVEARAAKVRDRLASMAEKLARTLVQV